MGVGCETGTVKEASPCIGALPASADYSRQCQLGLQLLSTWELSVDEALIHVNFAIAYYSWRKGQRIVHQVGGQRCKGN